MTSGSAQGKRRNLPVVLNIQAKEMTREIPVLSLDTDGQKLHGQESILRENGFEIISAATPRQARFEIEMGRCGTFPTSFITPFAIYRDLANLFRRSCPNGLVIFLTEHPDDNVPDADILFSGEEPPEAVLQAIRSTQEMNPARLP